MFGIYLSTSLFYTMFIGALLTQSKMVNYDLTNKVDFMTYIVTTVIISFIPIIRLLIVLGLIFEWGN